jgi:hypothetical protein
MPIAGVSIERGKCPNDIFPRKAIADMIIRNDIIEVIVGDEGMIELWAPINKAAETQ